MSFSQATITGVNPPVQHGSQLLLSWTSSSPAGTLFQVYVDQQLMWSGASSSCSVPLPSALARIDIGAIDSADVQSNQQASLPAAPARRATLSWQGGTFQAPDIVGFHVYGERSPGGGIDYSTILATIPAYTAGVITDGFGYGGFGQGSFGLSSGAYSWTSPPLSGGVWNWAVKPFDAAGNEGSAQTAAVTINAPPSAPAPFAGQTRLVYSYNPATKSVTLNWNASAPGPNGPSPQ